MSNATEVKPEHTREQVVQQLVDIASEQPDRVVDCKYLNKDNEPQCIIGVLLHRLGVDLSVLSKRNSTEISILINEGRLPVTFSDEASKLMASVQYLQDDGIPWGEAVRRARDDISMDGAA